MRVVGNCAWSPTVESWVKSDLISTNNVERMEKGLDVPMAAWWDGYVRRQKERNSKRESAVSRYLTGSGPSAREAAKEQKYRRD